MMASSSSGPRGGFRRSWRRASRAHAASPRPTASRRASPRLHADRPARHLVERAVGRGTPACLALVLATVARARLGRWRSALQRARSRSPAGTQRGSSSDSGTRGSVPGRPGAPARTPARPRPLRTAQTDPARRPRCRLAAPHIGAPAGLHAPAAQGPARRDPRNARLGCALRGPGRGRACVRCTPRLVPPAHLRGEGIAAQERVDGLRDVGVDGHAVAVAGSRRRRRTWAAPCARARTSGCAGGAPPRRRA